MKLVDNDIIHVAKLSNLKLTKTEVRKFKEQLSKVIDYVNELSEVNTQDIEPTSQTTGLANAYRSDEIGTSLPQSEALSGSEKIHNGYFVVPRILEERSEK